MSWHFPKLPSDLSTEQKIALVLLLFLGIGGITMGFLSFGANLRRPFDEQMALNASQDAAIVTPTEDQEMEQLKHQDTDGDGLSDYDEIYIYHTSPYLFSTAGDSISDKTKVMEGLDPNCATGKTCPGDAWSVSQQEATGTPSDASASLAASASPTAADATSLAAGTSTDTTGITDISNLTPTQVRSLLSQAGVPADQLSALTDDQVMQMYQQAEAQVTGGSSADATATDGTTSDTSTPPATSTPSTTPQASQTPPTPQAPSTPTFATPAAAAAYLKALAPADMRTILGQAGLASDKLSAMTDAQVTTAFDAAVDQAQKSGQLSSLVQSSTATQP